VLALTLEEARRMALSSNLDLALDQMAVDVFEFQFRGSWGSFDPVVTANAALEDSQFEGSSSLSGGDVLEENQLSLDLGLNVPLLSGGSFEALFNTRNSETNNSFVLVDPSTTDTWTLTFRQPLWRGLGRSYATATQRAAELLWRRERELLRLKRQELLQQVEDAYWELVAAGEQLVVAQQNVSLAEEQLSLNQRRLEAGVGTEVEVLQAETTVAQRVQEALARGNAVDAAEDLLKGLIQPGTDAQQWERRVQPITPLPKVSGEALAPWQAAVVVALGERSDLRAQRIEIERAEVSLAAAREDVQPQLDLLLQTASVGFDGDSSSAFEEASAWEFPRNQAGLSFRWPLRNRSAIAAEQVARAQLKSARLRYDALASTAVAQTRSGVRDVLYQAEAVSAAQKSADLAQRQLSAEQARYREGLSTNFQVLEFQQQLAAARQAASRALADYAKARTALAKAQGLLDERPRAGGSGAR
jgi:outer membrane protein TolC